MNTGKLIVKMALRLHNYSYKLASKLAIKVEGGLHPKHRLLNYHQFFLDHIQLGDVVLDIGCGNGSLTCDLAKKAKHIVGIDLRNKNKEQWKNRPSSNVEFLVADATSLQPQETFDVVVLSNVLEHIEHRVEFLKKIRYLAPLFLIRVPMLNRDWITLYKKELGIEYRLDKTHFTEYTLESFITELKEAGLAVKEHSIQFGEIWACVI